MPARTSVELHTDGCRIVDVVVRQTPGDVHVRAFVPSLPRDEQRRRRPDLTASLRQARTDHTLARDACVTIWGLRSSYQFLRLCCLRRSGTRGTRAQPSPSAMASPPIETVSASGSVVTGEQPVAATDPTTVAPPPEVDLASAPEWSRNPFAGRGQQRHEAPVAPAIEVEPELELIVASILHSADRRLAVVNGTIVRAGDRVGSSTIVEIQPRAVVVESSRGVRQIVELRVAPITRQAVKAAQK